MQIYKKIFLNFLSVNSRKNLKEPITEDLFDQVVINNVDQIEIVLKSVFGVAGFKNRVQYLVILAIERGMLLTIQIGFTVLFLSDNIFLCYTQSFGETITFFSTIIANTNSTSIIILPTIILCEQYIDICKKTKLPFATFNSTVTSNQKKKMINDCMQSLPSFSGKANVILTTPDSFVGEKLRLIISSLYRNGFLRKK